MYEWNHRRKSGSVCHKLSFFIWDAEVPELSIVVLMELYWRLLEMYYLSFVPHIWWPVLARMRVKNKISLSFRLFFNNSPLTCTPWLLISFSLFFMKWLQHWILEPGRVKQLWELLCTSLVHTNTVHTDCYSMSLRACRSVNLQVFIFIFRMFLCSSFMFNLCLMG